MIRARLQTQHHHSHLHVAWERIESQMGEVSICSPYGHRADTSTETAQHCRHRVTYETCSRSDTIHDGGCLQHSPSDLHVLMYRTP